MSFNSSDIFTVRINTRAAKVACFVAAFLLVVSGLAARTGQTGIDSLNSDHVAAEVLLVDQHALVPAKAALQSDLISLAIAPDAEGFVKASDQVKVDLDEFQTLFSNVQRNSDAVASPVHSNADATLDEAIQAYVASVDAFNVPSLDTAHLQAAATELAASSEQLDAAVAASIDETEQALDQLTSDIDSGSSLYRTLTGALFAVAVLVLACGIGHLARRRQAPVMDFSPELPRPGRVLQPRRTLLDAPAPKDVVDRSDEDITSQSLSK